MLISSNRKGETQATGFVAIDKTNKNVVLSLRGSASLQNWAADVMVLQIKCGEKLGLEGGYCHEGFYRFWEHSKNEGAITGIEKAMEECQGCPLIITGHSLGGAGAVLAAGELRARKKWPDITLVSS
jgi:predicted lipase